MVAAYNAASTLAQTLASVDAQTWRDFELIAVDDGSGDATAALLESAATTLPWLSWVRQANAGVAAARMHGIALSRGEYVAFLDADDLWEPGKLAAQMVLFERDPGVGFVYSDARDFHAHADARQTWFEQKKPARGRVLERLFEGNFALTSTVIVRARDLRELGGFDRAFKVNEDYDLWMKLAERVAFDYVDAVLVRRRVMASGLTQANQMACYRQDQAITESWAARRPDLFSADSPRVRRRRAVLYSRIGYQYLADRDFAAARDAYDQALRLGQNDPSTILRALASRVPMLARGFWAAKALFQDVARPR